ncbi:MAG: ATP-binding protein [Defluviitaleaceae bacterium]|nr:ATP-binding protein [Defluviitaleaceae bacterium]
MSFSVFLKKLADFYRGNENTAKFARSVLENAMTENAKELLPSDESNYVKLYGGHDITGPIARTVLDNPDKERFFDYLNELQADKADAMKDSFGLCVDMDVDELYEWIYENFLGYLNVSKGKDRRKKSSKEKSEFSEDNLLREPLNPESVSEFFRSNAITPVSKFAQVIDTIRDKEKNHKNPFHYLNANLGFYGREEELAYFDGFLGDDAKNALLLVTGCAGSGKSSFLHHVTKTISKEQKWKFVHVDQLLINDFSIKAYSSYLYEKPLRLIIDYAGRYAEKVGRFLSHISNIDPIHLPPKVRFVLIERQGITTSEANGEIYPDWFRRIKKACDSSLNLYENGFLELSELPESALKAVSLDYRNESGIGIMQKFNGDKNRFEEEWSKIYDTVNRRGTLTTKVRTIRPLIVLFMIDASISNLDYYKWDIDRILAEIISRYESHWEENLCAGDTQLFNAVKKILMYSTACESWTVGESIQGLEAESKILNELGREKLSQIIPYVNEYEIYEEKMLAFEPDLLGEFFVLKMLKNIASPIKRKELVKLFWSANAESFAFFLQMCVYDYSYSEYFKEIFEGFNELFLSHDNFAEKVESNEIIAGLLLEITYIGVPDRTKNAIEALGSLMERGKKDEYLALRYVTGIYNRLTDVGIDEGTELIKEIRRVAEQYVDSFAIFSTYCEAMNNLIIWEHLGITEADEGKALNVKLARITALLDTLLSFMDDNPYMGEGEALTTAVFFTKCIQNPMLVLKRRSCMAYLQKSCKMIEDAQAIQAIDEYICALTNFSSRDDVRIDDITLFYEPLRQWIQTYEVNSGKRYHSHIEILTNLTTKGEDIETWLTEVELLYRITDSEFVAPYYAMALCNLTYSMAHDAIAETSDFESALGKIKELIHKHSEPKIKMWYCRTLCNYFHYSLDASMLEWIGISREFTNTLVANFTEANISECEDFIIVFLNAVLKCCDDDECGIDVIDGFSNILSELRTAFPQIVQFAECSSFLYMRIANMYAEKNTALAMDAVNEIRAIHEMHLDNEFIADYFLDVVAEVSSLLPSEELEHEMQTATEIYKRFSRLPSIAEYYTLIIRNFTADCEARLIETCFANALGVFRNHSENEEVLENCISILDDFLCGTRDSIKANAMLDELGKHADFGKIESKECKTAHDDLMNRFREVREVSEKAGVE